MTQAVTPAALEGGPKTANQQTTTKGTMQKRNYEYQTEKSIWFNCNCCLVWRTRLQIVKPEISPTTTWSLKAHTSPWLSARLRQGKLEQAAESFVILMT